MKKLIALILAIVMMASMSVVAFAADFTLSDTDEPIEGQTKDNIPVNYTVTKGYTITIPAAFDLEEITDDATGLSHGEGSGIVTINAAKLDGGEKLEVTVDGTDVTGKDYANNDITTNWMMPDTKATGTKAASVGYTIELTGDQDVDDFEQEGVVIDHVYNDAPITSAGKSTTMTIVTNDTNQAGIYQDLLTFAVAIVAA